jgi:hypothetical protein
VGMKIAFDPWIHILRLWWLFFWICYLMSQFCGLTASTYLVFEWIASGWIFALTLTKKPFLAEFQCSAKK